MKTFIEYLIEDSIADIPPKLFDIHAMLYQQFKSALKSNQLDSIIADDIQELFQNMDNDMQNGDAGMVKAGLREIKMLLNTL